jgi:hypothetical protein
MQDISILDPKLLVIGEQVAAFENFIDLLCMNSNGDLVIVELKRAKTPREVTAQAIEYASWAKDLEAEDIENIAAKHLKGITLRAAFSAKFKNQKFPEVINERHAMRIVASEVDESTERIIRYLSENSIDINAVQFQFFKADNRQLLVRTFTVDPEQAEINVSRRPGKRTAATREALAKDASDAGVGNLYERFRQTLGQYNFKDYPMKDSLSFYGNWEGKQKSFWRIMPSESSAEKGLRYFVYSKRLSDFLHMSEDNLLAYLPANPEPLEPWTGEKGYAGYIRSEEEINKIGELLKDRMKMAPSA